MMSMVEKCTGIVCWCYGRNLALLGISSDQKTTFFASRIPNNFNSIPIPDQHVSNNQIHVDFVLKIHTFKV